MTTEEGSRTEDIINSLGASLGEPTVAVVGCGGAGSNIVHRMYWRHNRVETVAINTDEDRLANVDAHRKVLIGRDVAFGNDAGGFPEVGEHCAEKAREVIREALRGYDIIFVVAGMGGGTGTGVAPVVASVAKEINAVSFALPILPFDVEGDFRKSAAAAGVEKLREHADVTIVLDNNKLTGLANDIPLSEAMKVIDRSVMKVVESVTAHTSSYVSTLMEDVAGYVDGFEEVVPARPPEEPEQLIHADLTPMLGDFNGPSFF
jgi:cell division protein FtsZ